MKKVIFGIFAHPDDEAFGPSGALLKEVQNGNELHLITFTDGSGPEATNLDNLPNLGEVRLEEWHRAGELLGASSMHHLGYNDGFLNNHIMIQAAEKITEIVKATLSEKPQDIQIEFMSMDLNGVTGHIDHIVAARTACFVFYRLKTEDTRCTRIRLACWPREAFPVTNTDWIYMETGRTPEEIDETVDARELKTEITSVVRTHHTQRQDGENFLAWQGSNLGLCHFIVKT
jgi:LmbE family N-acetylglucosaminyl deacetylase